MDDFKKKISNIWYYYKIPIIIGVCVLSLVVGVIIDKKSEVKSDHSIAIISKSNYPSQEETNKLKNTFEDRIGGSFEVVIYNVALGEIGEDDVIISKLSLDIANTISEYYFIEDLDAFENATNNLKFKEIEKVENIDWLQDLGLDNFYYCIR